MITLSRLSRKLPPGLTFVGSLLFNWKLVSLPLILSAVFRPNLWQTILMIPFTLPISIATVVYLQSRRYAKRQKELGTRLPPSVPYESFGGLDLLKTLRREFYYGYIGNPYLSEISSRYKRTKRFLGETVNNWGEQLGHTMSAMIFWEPRVRGLFVPRVS